MSSQVLRKHNPEVHAFLRSTQYQFSASGVNSVLPRGPIDTLSARVNDFFRTSQGPQILLGALPFDREHTDYLIQPVSIGEGGPQYPTDPVYRPTGNWRVTSQPAPEDYGAMVTRALEAIERVEGPEKVVLARRLLVETDSPLDHIAVAGRLGRDPSITSFAVPLPALATGESRTLVGATPELLFAKKGRAIRSNPLAGSARRQANASEDREAASRLEKSDKNRREHALVVEAILDTLAPYCETLAVPANATLQSTASMWHLGSRIEGRLRDDSVSCAELVAQIHPTPAVCGFPREKAQALLRELEPFDRGFYAGVVGWLDAHGDGEWHIALRCGEICGSRITLYAGAGIVAGSDPATEIEETSAKFLALLNALGINEAGQPLGEERA